MVSIRLMEEKDTEEVLAMMRVFYASPAVLCKSPEAVLRQDIRDCIGDMPYIEGFVFAEEDEIVGYAMVAKGYTTEYSGLCIWIEDLYMKPEHRGKGISASFFSWLEDRYRGQAVRFKLEVEEENQAAIAAYKKSGYQLSAYLEMTKEL